MKAEKRYQRNKMEAWYLHRDS